MDFSFTPEQDMLRDTVARLVREQYDFETRRKVAKSEAGWRPKIWAQFAELGLLGASFSEAGVPARRKAEARPADKPETPREKTGRSSRSRESEQGR